MKQSDFLKWLEEQVAAPNYYSNKFPYNVCYRHADGRISYDCWNLIKCGISGCNAKAMKVGEHFPTNKFVCGDVDGATLLKKCYNRSKDFSKLSIPTTYLYLASSPHSGIYVGDRVVNGKTVNVIECTGCRAWGANGVVYSYVDEKGRRFNYKGGKQSLAWSEYGLLPQIELEEKPTVTTPAYAVINDSEITFTEYTIKKGDTLTKIAQKYNTTVATLLHENPHIVDASRIYVGQHLHIPVKTMQSSNSGDKSNKVYHTVQKGETLSGIAKKYGTTYIKIAALNGIVNPNKIYVGQKLRIR